MSVRRAEGEAFVPRPSYRVTYPYTSSLFVLVSLMSLSLSLSLSPPPEPHPQRHLHRAQHVTRALGFHGLGARDRERVLSMGRAGTTRYCMGLQTGVGVLHRMMQWRLVDCVAVQVKAPTPYTLHRTSYTLHPTSYTLHPTSYTLHPTSYTLHPPE